MPAPVHALGRAAWSSGLLLSLSTDRAAFAADRFALTRLEWRAARLLGLRAAAELQTIGDHLLDPYNLQRVPARRLVGASLSVSPLQRPLRFTLEGRNLGDDRACEVGGFPLPGRSLFVACTYRTGGPETGPAPEP